MPARSVSVIEDERLLEVRRLPGRLNGPQAAFVLGFAPHDIPILIRAGLLKPLGKPSEHAPKHFARSEVEEASNDRAWLDHATRALEKHWKRKNDRNAGPVGRRKGGRRNNEDVQDTGDAPAEMKAA